MIGALVTGSAGFLGYALADRLRRSMDVVGTVRQEMALPWPTIRHDWEEPVDHPGLTPRLLIHASFQPGRFAANENMARNVAEAALRMGTERVVLLSSGSVYAEQEEAIRHDTPAAPAALASPYAFSCARAEAIFASVLRGVPLRREA